MTDECQSRTTISSSGIVTVRQRPALLLMKVRLRATEATLELGLAKLKKQGEATSRWLKRLGAERVDFGEPHFADQADMDPLAKMRAVTARALGKISGEDFAKGPTRGVCVVLTAVWPIASMSAEETLVLVDRLRFESAADSVESEAAKAIPPWASAQEHMQAMITQMHQPPTVDDSPQFLFIARLSEEQRQKATAEAFSRAHENAQRLAQAAGMRLGTSRTIHSTAGGMADVSRPDKLMDRQRCWSMLAGSSYDLGEHEIVFDDPRCAEITVSVNVSYSVE